MQSVHNQFHSGLICSRSISHVSMLNLDIDILQGPVQGILLRNIDANLPRKKFYSYLITKN